MATFNQLQVEQYLTGVLQNYREMDPAFFVADRLAPIIPITSKHGKLAEEGAEQNYLHVAERAPGAAPGEVVTSQAAGISYLAVERTIRERVTDEEVAAGQESFGIDVLAQKALKLAKKLKNIHEAKTTALFTSVDWFTRVYSSGLGYFADYATQVVTLLAGSHWNDNAVDPSDAIDTAKEWFVQNAPFPATHVILSEETWLAVGANTNYRTEYGDNRDLQPVAGMLPRWRELEVVVSRGKFDNQSGGWVPFLGNHCWVGRLGPLDQSYTSYAGVLQYTGDPVDAVRTYRDADEGRRSSWVEATGGTRDYKVLQSGGSTQGYLIRDCKSV